MPTIAHSTIVASIKALLEAAPALADGGVHRARGRPMGEGLSRLVVVRKEGAFPSPGPILAHPVGWRTEVAIECYARGADSTVAPDEACDELLLEVYDRLMADPTLGGLAMDVLEPRITWDTDEQDRRLGCAVAVFPVLHRTRGRTLVSPT